MKCLLCRFAIPALLAVNIAVPSLGQLLHQETFETDGDGTRYELFDRGHEDSNTPDQASGWGIWGHNFDAPANEIGLLATAPAKRAGILWNHEDPISDFGDIISPESLDLWVSVVKWATDDKAGAKVGVFPSTFPLGVEVVTERLAAEGYEIEEIFLPEDATPDFDVMIHSSETGSPSFVETPIPIITFSGGDHDDLGLTGIGAAVDFLDPANIEIPASANGHPALGGLTGTVPWTTDAAQLQTLGKLHNGGTSLANVTYEDPVTGDDVEGSALFVIEKGDPLLGAFNPDPEGDGYIVGAALNKFGEGGEKQLTLNPIDISGHDDVNMTVMLAATAADFENGDYLRIEAIVDGDETIIEEFFGVNAADTDCHKGLSNNEAIDGEVGDICLPTEAFGEYTFDIPSGNSLELRFSALTTWGNELIGIDNIRVHAGELPPTGPTGDFNGSGERDPGDLDLLAEQMIAGSTDAEYDLNGDGKVDIGDRNEWLDITNTYMGDSNFDGEFSSSDFVTVFGAAKYETGGPATWAEGDWNGDGAFNSSDFVAAFSGGGYEAGPREGGLMVVPEPSCVVLLAGALCLLGLRRR